MERKGRKISSPRRIPLGWVLKGKQKLPRQTKQGRRGILAMKDIKYK